MQNKDKITGCQACSLSTLSYRNSNFIHFRSPPKGARTCWHVLWQVSAMMVHWGWEICAVCCRSCYFRPWLRDSCHGSRKPQSAYAKIRFCMSPLPPPQSDCFNAVTSHGVITRINSLYLNLVCQSLVEIMTIFPIPGHGTGTELEPLLYTFFFPENE